MALRLTNTPSPAVAAAEAAPHLVLVDRARAALARRDTASFLAAAGDTGALTDHHRRYVTRRSLLEAGLQAAEALTEPAEAAKLLVATAQAGLDVLGETPAEPVLLNLTGAALFRLGSLDGAETLMRAAAGLDPATQNVQANLDAIGRLRRSRQTLRPQPAVAGRVAELTRLARRVAERAVPAAEASIALCMIVRDEEATLARALRSARDVVDEIVVVDTGSTDRTTAIAREHGATVLEHAWDDDFAAARNVGLEAATADWILYLDADEELAPADAERLPELARRTWREGYLLTIVNRVGDADGATALTQDVLRMFRNRPDHRFEGIVHESVLQCLPADAPERLEAPGVRIDHDGYLAHTREAKEKSQRNLELLERQLRENGASLYLLFNIGSELLAAGEPEEAVEHLVRAWELLLDEPDPTAATFASALVTRAAAALRAAGRPADAIALADRGLEHFDGFTDLVLEQALAHRDAGDPATAERLLRTCLELGDAPARYTAVTGAGSFIAATELGRLLLRRGESAQAAGLLARTVADHPRHDPARLALADALAAQARFAEAADAVAPIAERSPLAGEAVDRAALYRAAGEDIPGELPGGALRHLADALHARLNETDIDGFVALLPLTERVAGLGSRGRRQLLATLYLAHGFLDSAADEWAAACEEHGPDAAALAGLSRVAAARGNQEDAELFAAGARELAAQGAA